jgi:hypothetical protein
MYIYIYIFEAGNMTDPVHSELSAPSPHQAGEGGGSDRNRAAAMLLLRLRALAHADFDMMKLSFIPFIHICLMFLCCGECVAQWILISSGIFAACPYVNIVLLVKKTSSIQQMMEVFSLIEKLYREIFH